MREEGELNWFARWEEQLPPPEELTPLSQTLITHDLALAFDIPTAAAAHLPSNHHSSAATADFETSDLNSASAVGCGGGGDEPARTLKRPRLVWTPQLHKRFVDAVAQLGIKNAVPKTIMQLMSVDGLTRENVASHLQKYRLYLKRMQGLSASSVSGGGGGPGSDAATDLLFASAPVPHHFLIQGPPTTAGPGGAPEPFLPFVPVAALQHHQQITAAMQHQQQQQYYHHRQMSQFGSPTARGGGGGGGGGLEHGFLSRNVAMQRIAGPAAGIGLVQPPPSPSLAVSYLDELGSGRRGGASDRNGRRTELTLFPTGGGND